MLEDLLINNDFIVKKISYMYSSLKYLSKIESYFVKNISVPFGTSIIAVTQKRNDL